MFVFDSAFSYATEFAQLFSFYHMIIQFNKNKLLGL